MKIKPSTWFSKTIMSPFFYIFVPLVWMSMMTFMVRDIVFEMLQINEQLIRIEMTVEELLQELE